MIFYGFLWFSIDAAEVKPPNPWTPGCFDHPEKNRSYPQFGVRCILILLVLFAYYIYYIILYYIIVYYIIYIYSLYPHKMLGKNSPWYSHAHYIPHIFRYKNHHHGPFKIAVNERYVTCQFICLGLGYIWEWVKIPLLSIGMGWTFIYHLFLGSLSTRLLTHSHLSLYENMVITSKSVG